jgi:hypothetical protein
MRIDHGTLHARPMYSLSAELRFKGSEVHHHLMVLQSVPALYGTSRRKGGTSLMRDREGSIVAYASPERLIFRARGFIYSIRGKTSN